MEMNKHAVKIKLLKIVEILYRYTDTNNMLTTSEMQERLLIQGIETDRRTLSNDMKVLRQNGYDILISRKNRQNAYCMNQQKFTLSELVMMRSAVQAANFISNTQTNEMLIKIAKLAGDEAKTFLKNNHIQYNSRKYNNLEVFRNIEKLEEAIINKKTASFMYFDLNENREKVYRKNKDRYIVDPVTLIYFEDFFYLITWNVHYSDITTYRVDRMSDVKIENRPINKNVAEILKARKPEKLVTEAFKLFAGREKSVKLTFGNKLIGPVFDKFGERVQIKRVDENICTAEVIIQESPAWRGWVAQFEGEMKIE